MRHASSNCLHKPACVVLETGVQLSSTWQQAGNFAGNLFFLVPVMSQLTMSFFLLRSSVRSVTMLKQLSSFWNSVYDSLSTSSRLMQSVTDIVEDCKHLVHLEPVKHDQQKNNFVLFASTVVG